MNQDSLIPPPLFFFIHPQKPTAGLGFRFQSVESAAVPGLVTHQPAATPAGKVLVQSLGHTMKRGPLTLQPKCDPRRFRSKQYSCRKGRPLGQGDKLTWPCMRGRWLLTAEDCHMPGVLLIALRIALLPCVGHPFNKQNHKERWGLTQTNLQDRDTANDRKCTLHGNQLITLYVNQHLLSSCYLFGAVLESNLSLTTTPDRVEEVFFFSSFYRWMN